MYKNISFLMNRLTFVIFLLFFLTTFRDDLKASPLFLGDEIVASIENEQLKQLKIPDPSALNPQWWKYFEVEGNDLQQHINLTTQYLQGLYPNLPEGDQEIAIPYINNIIFNLKALPGARAQKVPELNMPKVYSNSYTLEQQLELNRKMRRLEQEKSIEDEELAQYRLRVSKTQGILDNLLVEYLAIKEPTPKKLLTGLEIMSHQAALAVAKEHLRIIQDKIDQQIVQIGNVKSELEIAKSHLVVNDFDQFRLEKDIKNAEAEVEKRQAELLKTETSSLGSIVDPSQDRATRYLLQQKVLHASAKKALAWTRLAFQQLKYTLFMHLSELLKESNSELRETMRSWHEHLQIVAHQAEDWRKLALREQDRVRNDYAQNLRKENGDSRALQLNQTRRQESLDILSTIQQLEDEIANVNWLKEQLEYYIQTHSGMFERFWTNLTKVINKISDTFTDWLSVSLFKITGIPITLLTIVRIFFILGITALLAKYIQSGLLTIVTRRAHLSDSALYTLGRLIHYFILFIGAIIALFSIGLDFSNLVILAGALTFGIGLGMQTVVMNFVAGVRILFERKLKIGDEIELPSGHKGKVHDIRVFNTVVCTSDGVEVVVPNSELTGSTLVNCTMSNNFRRLHIPFSVAYNCDKELVRKVVVESVKKVPCTVKHADYEEAQVWLENFDKSSLDLKLVVWVDLKKRSHTDSKEADYLWEIESALRKHKIEIPNRSIVVSHAH